MSGTGTGTDGAAKNAPDEASGAPMTPRELLERYEQRRETVSEERLLRAIVEPDPSKPRIDDDPVAVALLQATGPVIQAVLAVLTAHDPIGVVFEENSDEYEPEARTIALRLMIATAQVEGPAALATGFSGLGLLNDVRRMVHGEFVRWFDEETAGPEIKYTEVAREILDLR